MVSSGYSDAGAWWQRTRRCLGKSPQPSQSPQANLAPFPALVTARSMRFDHGRTHPHPRPAHQPSSPTKSTYRFPNESAGYRPRPHRVAARRRSRSAPDVERVADIAAPFRRREVTKDYPVSGYRAKSNSRTVRDHITLVIYIYDVRPPAASAPPRLHRVPSGPLDGQRADTSNASRLRGSLRAPMRAPARLQARSVGWRHLPLYQTGPHNRAAISLLDRPGR